MSIKLCVAFLFFLLLLLSFDAAAAPVQWPDTRMAAWHKTIVAVDEKVPNACLSTYIEDKFSIDCYGLAKIVTGVETGGKLVWTTSARDIGVEDFPGGVRAIYFLGGIKITTEFIPLMVGRGTPEQEGAALFTVKASPAAPVVIKCGEGMIISLAYLRSPWLRKDGIGNSDDSARIEDGIGLLKSLEHPLAVAVKADGPVSVEKGTDGGKILLIRLERGDGNLLLSFANEEKKAKKITALKPRAEVGKVNKYYAKLLRSRIETPEKHINQAFRSALYNLEYNWLEPLGWNESIHHWPALWHMQHTAGAEWIGQSDRSRLCIVTTAEHLLPNEAVTQFLPSGMIKRDFGGSNQYYAREINHYWDFTADRGAIKYLLPILERVIRQTFKEYDPDCDGLLAWGQQIGNQEDYVSTPFNGTTPSVEGINMLKTAANIAKALGERSKAAVYTASANEALAALKSELWQPDLGRFAYFKDPLGVVRLDGQYHTLIYPVIYGMLDPLDSWTSIGHLRDRLMGENGAAYLSNCFPSHVGGTWGMQSGVAQQPWTAWGLAAVGLRNEAYRPLKVAAEWVMNKDHRGSWPEINTEPSPSYFSPPAGLFIQSTIEALFGLEAHKPEEYLKVSPSFPDHWPYAKLYVPDYTVSYRRNGNTLDYTVTSAGSLSRRLRWMLPPCRIKNVEVNGKKADWSIAPGVNCITLKLDTPPARSTRFRISYEPVYFRVGAPKSVAEGDALSVDCPGLEIERLDDRCGVLSSIEMRGSSIRAAVRDGILKPYLGFGRIGKMNFSRRTFFLLGKAVGVRFWVPVEITILPRYECAPVGEILMTPVGGVTRFVVRNNTSAPLKGAARLNAAQYEFPVRLDIAPRSQKAYQVTIPKNLFALLSPGDNKASLILPNSQKLNLTLTASKLFDSSPELKMHAQSRMIPIPLPEDMLKPDADWQSFRTFYAYTMPAWMFSKPPMESFAGMNEVSVPGLPAVTFKLSDRKLLPISRKLARPAVTLDLKGEKYKKLYLLVVPFLDNHDTFSEVAEVDVTTDGAGVYSRILRFPGNLDLWCPEGIVGECATARKPRLERFGLLPMPEAKTGDWPEAKPPAFPQNEFWATCLPFKTASSVMNIIEIDLGRAISVKSVTLSTIGIDPALGLVAVTGETAGDVGILP